MPLEPLDRVLPRGHSCSLDDFAGLAEEAHRLLNGEWSRFFPAPYAGRRVEERRPGTLVCSTWYTLYDATRFDKRQVRPGDDRVVDERPVALGT